MSVSMIFSDSELQTLLESAIAGGATDEQCHKFIEWAATTKIRNAILQTILLGEKTAVTIDEESGEPKLYG